VLGVLLTTSTSIAPERLYPWFGLVSGLLVLVIGTTLVRRALRMRRRAAPVERSFAPAVVASPEDERILVGAAAGAALGSPGTGHRNSGHADHDHGHGHHGHAHVHLDHHHGHGHHGDDEGHHEQDLGVPHTHSRRMHAHAPIDPALGWRSLLMVGFAGGLVPNPSALVVLLGAIALGRTWFGLLVVVAYGIGMAVTLTGAGLLLVRARGLLDRRSWATPGGRIPRLTRLLPLLTSTIIVVVGCLLTLGAAAKL
jgi:nickel/cobalt exporter